MLALVYDKLGIMGKAESCAREVRPAPAERRPGHRTAGAVAGPRSAKRVCVRCAQAAKVDKKDLDMLLLLGKCEENRGAIAAAAAAGGGGKAEFYLAQQTYSKAIKLDPDGFGEAAKGLERAGEGMARADAGGAAAPAAAAAAPAKKETATATGAVGVPEACKFMASPALEGMSVEEKSAFLVSKGVDSFVIAQATCVTNEDNVQGHPELPAAEPKAAPVDDGSVGVPAACKFMADPTLEGMSVEDKSAFLASKGVDAFVIAQATCVTNEDTVQGHPELPAAEEKPAAAMPAAGASSLQAAAPDGFEWGNTY